MQITKKSIYYRYYNSCLVRFLTLAFLVSGTEGCTSAVVGAGATTGLAIYDERGIKGVTQDALTKARLRAKILEYSTTLATKIGIDVYANTVLLTGAISDEKMMANAVHIAWSIKSVSDVINEIQLTDTGIVDIARDSWITMQFRARMTLDEDIFAVNYSCETVNGVLYIIGLAQNKSELNRVISLAKQINYVRKVVDHVWLKKEV